MLFTDVIRTKRDGNPLTEADIGFLVSGLSDASIPAEQISSLAMAIFLNGMSFEEASILTLGMARSGTVLNWSDCQFDGPVVDKHSTGGVGDKVSFLLAPIAAACGCYVPMISGRGLGHTGGTTDKVECIPGYQSMPDFDLFRRVVKTVGCAVIGQTNELAPADKRFYAIRDVTSTVESVPLITASILAKKIAAGLEALVMDVKVGSGAFMESVPQASELAKSIIGTASRAGLKTHAILTDMNEVLGDTAGNSLEIVESIEYLTNAHREPRLDAVTVSLCAEMLVVTGMEANRQDATATVERAIASGDAAEKFSKMVGELGGPPDFVENYSAYLPAAKIVVPVTAVGEGVLSSVVTQKVGNAIIELGGGRRVLGESLDHSVGFSEIAHIGEVVGADKPLAIVHASSEETAQIAASMLREACQISSDSPPKNDVIVDILTPE